MDGIIASEAEAAAGPGGTATEANGVRTLPLPDAEAEDEASPGGGPRAASSDDGDPDLGGVEDVVDVEGADEEGPSAPDRRAPPAPPDVEERELVEREDAESSGSSAAGMSGDTRGSGSGGYSGDYSSISDSSSERGSSGTGGSEEKKEMTGKKSLVAHNLPHRSKDGRSGPERGGADGGTAGASKPKPGAKEGGTGAAGSDARRSPASEGLLRPLRDGATPDQRPESNAHRRHSPGHRSHPHQHQHHQHQFLNQEPHHSYHRHAHHHPARGGNKAKAKVNRKIDEIMNLYNVSLQAAATREGDVDAAGDDIKRPGDNRRDSLQVEADGTDGYLEPLPPSGEARAPQPQLGGTTAHNPADPRVQAQQPYRTASTAVAYPAAVPVAVPHLYRPLAASASRASSAIEARPRDLEAPADVPPVGYRAPRYADLMEACRPFFHDSQALLAATASGRSIPMLPTVRDGTVDGAGRANAGSDEAQSSSGFTSFFTTTKSESNQTHSGSGGSLSEPPSQRRVARANAAEQQRQRAGLQHAGHQHAALQHAPRERAGAMNADPAERARLSSSPSTEATKRSPSPSDDIVDSDHSDSSSMVVLARVKRKHKEQGGSRPAVGPGGAAAARSSSNSDLTQASPHAPKRGSAEGVRVGGAAEHPGSSKRVRIETVWLDRASKRPRESAGGQGQQQKQPPERRTESSSFTSSLTQSLDSSGSDSGARPKEAANVAAEGGGSGSNADSKSDPAAGEGTSASQDAGTAGKPRVVTDISSGTTTANGSSGSGTGSGVENTTGKSESGSGGDGKSESGSGDGDGGSDGQNNKLPSGPEGGQSAAGGAAPPLGAEAPAPEGRKADKPLIHHHAGRHDQADRGQAPSEGSDAGVVAPCGAAAAAPDRREEEAEAATTSKEKIMVKKRKRMNMRREYEEEVQRQMRDSSESSSIAYETALEPGKPVTLEEVLSFTKTARLLVQALPPFLAVHVNAAFTSLCGIQSPSAIGTPVASIISLPDTTVNKESDSSGSDNTNNKDAMSSLSGSVDGNGQNNSNMAIANDAAMQGDAVGPQGPNAQVQNGVGLRIDRLIVARGYGHIHEVEVVSVPHHSHAHAIEGSEVRFMEGNAPAKRKKKGESKILCRMSVSPVISTTPATRHHSTADANSIPPTSANGKRRKLRPAPNELNSVKHYLIQLEAVEGPRLLMSRSSCTSATDTTMEAQLLGITKTEVYARRCRLENHRVQNTMEAQVNDSGVNGPETEDSQDDNASGMEP
ncbi:hypothetical protein ACHAWF_012281, partial [Thalassiosira exigua]